MRIKRPKIGTYWDEGSLSSPPRSLLFYYPPLIPLSAVQRSTTMLVSGKLFAVLIAAAITGVTGSPVELEKRQATVDFYYCIETMPGPAQACAQYENVDWDSCISLGGELDKSIISINPYGFICTLYT
jgi:hypothetical protein